jgi:hypothetical protein
MGGPQWTDDDFQRARTEASRLLGFTNAENLSAADNLKVDLVTSLRAVVDDASASVLEGNQTDLGKLVVAVEHLTKLLPQNQEPASRGADPRAHMWAVYSEMRRRGELAEPMSTYEGRGRRIAELEAENKSLRAALGSGSTASITPPTCDIVPPGERAECDPGPRPGPDDPPRRSSQVIEGKVNPTPAATPAPAYDYNKERGWRDYVLPDGNISPTPFGGGGKWWGPV